MSVSKEEFDRVQEIGRKLKELFQRDNVGGLNGMEDYLVRSVEEAQRLTMRAPDWIYWRCKFCNRQNIYTNIQCAHCGKPSSR